MIKSSDVKQLRLQTGAPMMECKRALEEADGDFRAAKNILKKRGQKIFEKKAGREAHEGVIESYVHANGKIGVLVEVNCETDFVAKNPEFKAMAHEIAMQIAASNPKYISTLDVPEQELLNEREVMREMFKKEKKPAKILDKIINGKIQRYKEEISLLNQPLVRNPKKTVEELIQEKTAKFGEKIIIKRFVRYEM
ncbi:MAG: translation elongation factor Ts [Patescibacteria group bacterium]